MNISIVPVNELFYRFRDLSRLADLSCPSPDRVPPGSIRSGAFGTFLGVTHRSFPETMGVSAVLDCFDPLKPPESRCFYPKN